MLTCKIYVINLWKYHQVIESYVLRDLVHPTEQLCINYKVYKSNNYKAKK